MQRLAILLTFLTFLVACDSAEERAEKHYQTAVALIEEGDPVRGLLELRNVFQLNGYHREARRLYAETVLSQGRTQEAYSQYLRLKEQYPEDLGANRQLALLSVRGGALERARPYIDVLLAKEPENLETQALDAWVRYQKAASSDRRPERDAALNSATALLAEDPALVFARQTVIAYLLQSREWAALIEQLDAALTLSPQDIGLYRLRLLALEQLGNSDEIEQTLLTMTQQFPKAASIGRTLVRWYLSHNKEDAAEAWLQGNIDPDATEPEPRLSYVNFLLNLRGEAAALAELSRLETLAPQPTDIASNFGLFASLQSAIMFNLGDHEAAMSRLEGLIAEPDIAPTDIDRMKVALAQMHEKTGNEADARTLVGAVLERDATQVEALKMKAQWQIEADDTAGAIANLQTALDQDPKALDVLSLLAFAYEREGSRELLMDTLELAVEVSNRAPDESLRLAQALFQEEQYQSAEEVLIEALRLDQFNIGLLHQLAQLHIELADWGRATQEIDRLRSLASPQATAAADDLEATLLLRQNKSDDLMRFVEERAGEDSAGEAAAIRALIVTGQTDVALERAEALFAKDPETASAKFVLASVLTRTGQDQRAIELFQQLIAEDASRAAVWRAIYAIHQRRGDTAKMIETLDQAALALPDDTNLKWERAGYYEAIGNPEAAIEIYEEIYAQDSNNAVIANNLASLLSTTRSDEQSLERAYVVARRLRGTDVPAFSDTYGWIAFRRGDLGEAILHLEKAESGLPNDPSVAYHLGRAYAAATRLADAEEKLKRAEVLIAQTGETYPGLQAAVTEARANLTASQSSQDGN